MRCVVDVEANGLEDPTKIWVIVCKDIDTGERHVFRCPSDDPAEKERFLVFAGSITLWIGHNWLGYDYLVLNSLLGLVIDDVAHCSVDTLVISKLVDYSREGHSVEDYGVEFGLPKQVFTDFSHYSPEMEVYCARDVDITERIYHKYLRIISSPEWSVSIDLEQRFQSIVNRLHQNGFSFNSLRASNLLSKIEVELKALDDEILKEFPPREVLIREFTPKLTKFGTISKSSVPKVLRDRIHEFEAGKTYPLTRLVPFNPASHKQIVDVLHEAGWKPEDKTKTRLDLEREINRLRYQKKRDPQLDLGAYTAKLVLLEKYGWKINEFNLSTLPAAAPTPARTLAKRILLESRRRTLTEWLGLVRPDSRIHGKFYGIGAWTHRMAHQAPNTANIPNKFDTAGKIKLYGEEMRSLWRAPRNRLLVGVDAEGIQLRIFAHYINDPEFTRSLVEGKKDDKTDPHSLNQRIMGSVCKSRQAAKRFIYALLLGAGIGKLAEILECPPDLAKEVLNRILLRYTGFKQLKEESIPRDGKRGYFRGLDGRRVRLPGDTEGAKRHLCMSGYLQNGEAVVMKKACLHWHNVLEKDGIDFKLVNFVHDEWQTECPNDMKIALHIAQVQADSLRIVGEELGLLCPLAGSFWNEDHKDYTIGPNWSVTH